MRLGAKRHISMTANSRKRVARTILFSVCIFLLLYIGVYGYSVLRPAYCSLAENRAKEIAVQTVNRVITEQFAESETDYHDIMDLEYTQDNQISAVKSNLMKVNQLKSALNLKIQKSISELSSQKLQIPVGTLTGSELFAGAGPAISFQIKPYGNVVTDLTTEFTQAGINQTKCSVTIHVKAQVGILSLMARKNTSVETSVPVFETVIVGNVPQSYTHVQREGEPYEEDVMDLLN